MLNNFKDTNSIIRRIHPVFKMLSILFMFIISLFVNSYIDIIVITGYLILCYTYSNIKIKVFDNIVNKMVVFLILLFIILLFSSSINNYLFNIFRCFSMILYIYIFVNAVSSLEILYASYKFFKPFKNIIKIDRVSFMILFIFKYLNLPIKEYRRIKNIQNIKYKSFEDKIQSIQRNISLAIYSANEKISRIITCLKDRLYGYSTSRTSCYYHKNKFINIIFIAINICILIIVIYY